MSKPKHKSTSASGGREPPEATHHEIATQSTRGSAQQFGRIASGSVSPGVSPEATHHEIATQSTRGSAQQFGRIASGGVSPEATHHEIATQSTRGSAQQFGRFVSGGSRTPLAEVIGERSRLLGLWA
jgi:hypothetical protein